MFLRKASAAIFAFPVILLSACVAASDSENRWMLAEGGEARSTVIVSEDATSIENHAADELAGFLSAVTGAEIRRTHEPVPGKYSIWLGTPLTNPGIDRAGVRSRIEELSGQGYLLHSGQDGLVIAGNSPLGAMFGAYGFLEDHVGMRWFFPGEEGEFRPEIPDLSIGLIDDLQEPSFERRTVDFSRVGGQQLTVDTWDWIARNRMQSRLHEMRRDEYEKRGAEVRGGGHILHRMVPDSLFGENPEYFGMYDGERRKQEGHRGQPCTTHPDVIELVSEYMLEWFRDNPDGIFTLNNNDYPNFCECLDCVALDPPEERERSRVSTRFFTFKSEVAGRVWEEMPEARIRTLAYQRFRMPPSAFTPEPGLQVILCDHYRCFRHSLDDPGCEVNRWFREMFEGWAEFENPRGNFPYYNMIVSMPREGIVSVPLENVVSSDMRYMHGLGHSFWSIRVRPPDAEYENPWDTQATREEWRANFQWIYVQAKLAWNIGRSTEEILAGAYERFYGPAAGHMGDYHGLKLRLWEDYPGHFIEGRSFRELGRMLEDGRGREELLSHLYAAREEAGKEQPYRRRVDEEIRIFEESWLKAFRQL